MNTDDNHYQKFKKIYETLNSNSKKFGKFHKCLFHLHTPASHDYRLYENKEDENFYKKLNNEDMFRLAIKENLFLNAQIENLTDLPLNSNFSDYKEYLTYLLIAKQLIDNEIELVLIADHNTIKGFDKLKKAISITCKGKVIKAYPIIILGIEISCGDKNHVVGIFEDTEIKRKAIETWLENNLMSEKDGTYYPSYDVIDDIKNTIGGVAYIAHINSSNIFKKGYLSSAYKERLFTRNGFNTVGIKSIDSIESMKNKIRKYRKDEIRFVLDSDSHAIDSISKSIFWIKGEKCNFRMISDAIRDYNISMEFEPPKQPNCYIKGLWVEGKGFLVGGKDKQTEPFWITLTESLNCFMGGKGTGKSSVLILIEFLLSQKVNDKKTLEMITSYSEMYLLYYLNGVDYLIGFFPPIKQSKEDNILKYYEEESRMNSTYNYKYSFNAKSISEYALKNYISLLEIKNTGKEFSYNIITSNIRGTLNKFFNKRYAISDLVNIASNNEELNRYIFDTIAQNTEIRKRITFRKLNTIEEIYNVKKRVNAVVLKRNNEIHEVIDKYNLKQKHQLKIEYNQDAFDDILLKWEQILIESKSKEITSKYNITYDSIIGYMYSLNKIIKFDDIIKLFINKEYDKISELINLLDYTTELDFNQVEKYIILNESNKDILLSHIRKSFVENNIIGLVNNTLEDYFSNMEYLSISFNINNKETNDRIEIFKDISYLSQGQKVVAMLSFILSYSEFTNDNTPLIIDQPEDNLDNSYIYKNLVEKLKSIRSLRQVIIATHSSTIVTNAKAEQVVVMESDNNNGWVKCKGYPSTSEIINEIINHLEGGNDSFIHKYYLYKDSLIEA